jgi:hypothetical protein
MIKFDVFE